MLRISVICHGNICRSAMGMFMLRQELVEQGVLVTSAGVSAEERDNPMDRRAARVLEHHGVPAGAHIAHQITTDELVEQDLVLAMTVRQREFLTRMRQSAGVENPQVALITEFDPHAQPNTEVDDPWYGDTADFERCYAEISACLPGIVAWVKDHV